MNEAPTDYQLVQRVQAGNKAAFDLLVVKYQSRVLQLISRYIKDRMEAEDVAQESFIKAYKGLANFRGESAFYTWLYRIAVNTAKNHIVASTRRPSSSALDTQQLEYLEQFADSQDLATPELLIESEQMHKAVMHCIDNLPANLRDAICLREFDGFSYEEIATIMDCPVGTVRSRIFRARDAIEIVLNDLAG